MTLSRPGEDIVSRPGRQGIQMEDALKENGPNLPLEDEKLDFSGPATLPMGPIRSRTRNLVLYLRLSPIRPFSGIIQDIRARAPYYLSDWTDAWNYRVIPATLLIFCAK